MPILKVPPAFIFKDEVDLWSLFHTFGGMFILMMLRCDRYQKKGAAVAVNKPTAPIRGKSDIAP